MAIIWQSSWFWVMLSAVLLIVLGSVVFKINTPQILTETNHTAIPTPTMFSSYISPNIWQPLHSPNQLDDRLLLLYDNIVVSTPNCYDLASGEYDCIGQVSNNSSISIGDISINMSFFDESGAKIAQKDLILEQRLIPSGTSAPYRALIYPPNDEAITNTTRIERSINRIFPPSPNIRTLNVINARSSVAENGRYNVALSIENNSGYNAQNIRLFTTLENTEWGIVGYDVYEVEQDMQSGAIHQIAIEIIPHVQTEEIEASFHAEAIIHH